MVGFVVEAQGSDIVEVNGKLGRYVAAEIFDADGLLFLQDERVSFFFVYTDLKAFPRKPPAEEVDKHISQRFQIVAVTLVFDSRSVLISFLQKGKKR